MLPAIILGFCVKWVFCGLEMSLLPSSQFLRHCCAAAGRRLMAVSSREDGVGRTTALPFSPFGGPSSFPLTYQYAAYCMMADSCGFWWISLGPVDCFIFVAGGMGWHTEMPCSSQDTRKGWTAVLVGADLTVRYYSHRMGWWLGFVLVTVKCDDRYVKYFNYHYGN